MKSKFTGKLNQPIKVTEENEEAKVLAYLAGGKVLNEYLEKEQALFKEKISLLMEHYKIADDSDNSEAKLLLALIEDFVPGFQTRNPVGRKTKWNKYLKAIAVVEMEREISQGKTQEDAAKQLAREPWLSFVNSNDFGSTSISNPAEVLRKQYHEFKGDKFVDTFRNVFKKNQASNQLDLWDSFVNNIIQQYIKK